MAKKNKGSLIGYDPLATMNEMSEEVDAALILGGQVASEAMGHEVALVDESKIILLAAVDIQNVSALYKQLKSVLESNELIEIDVSAVTSIDTSALQLFTVLKQTAMQLNKRLIFEFPSEQFVEAAKFCGLAELLEVDQAAAGFF